MAPRPKTSPPAKKGIPLFVLFAVVIIGLFPQPGVAQSYCDGRSAITVPAANCGNTSVCSPLMAAVTQTMNWWNGTNNTVGNSQGVAFRNFFSTSVYTPLLKYTNLNAYNGKDTSTACKKIAAIVNELLMWANTSKANTTLGNATYAATAKNELFGTVIQGWGYTIGQYVACGGNCTNSTSTTSTTGASSSTSGTSKAPSTSTTGGTSSSSNAPSTTGGPSSTASTSNAPSSSTSTTSGTSSTSNAPSSTPGGASSTSNAPSSTNSGTLSTLITSSTGGATPASQNTTLTTNTSAFILGSGYFTHTVEDVIFADALNFLDAPIAGTGCSTPNNELQYVPGLNTPQSAFYSSLPASFVPSQQGKSGIHSADLTCNGYYFDDFAEYFFLPPPPVFIDYNARPATMCVCSPNGQCYTMNGTGLTSTLYFYTWCGDASGDNCATYLGYCSPTLFARPTTGVFVDAASGEAVTTCTAINANQQPLGECYPGSTNCSYLPVVYANCGPCPNATLKLECPGPIDPVCEVPPDVASSAAALVLHNPAPGESFPSGLTSFTQLGSCNNCSSPNTTQYYYADNGVSSRFYCTNATNATLVDWSGFCACDRAGTCYTLGPLSADVTASSYYYFFASIFIQSGRFIFALSCVVNSALAVILEDSNGNTVFACNGEYFTFGRAISSLTCSGGCPAVTPLELYCAGPFVPLSPTINTSTLTLGGGDFTDPTSPITLGGGFIDSVAGGAGCSSPYSELTYLPGVNTPQSRFYSSLPASFVPSKQNSPIVSASVTCVGIYYDLITGHTSFYPATMCLCSPDGTCYNLNTTKEVTQLSFYVWCGDQWGDNCVTYLGWCANNPTKVGTFWNAATGEVVTNCTAINTNQQPLQQCYSGSTNCSYLPVVYANCGPCPNATLELECPGPIDAVCEVPPMITANFHPSRVVMQNPAPGENFPMTSIPLNPIATCDCTSPNMTQLFFRSDLGDQPSPSSPITFTCQNGVNTSQVDWTGFCMCNLRGACYSFRPLPDGSTTLNRVLFAYISTDFLITLGCNEANPNVVLEDTQGNAVFSCVISYDIRFDGLYSQRFQVSTLACNGGCPSNSPNEIYCPGPFECVSDCTIY